MIELIRLANFQRHSRFEMPLDPKITTIAGPSDVGKSSILRALRWVALNNPQGDSFVREGTKGTTVQVRVDGHTITRKRGGSLNTYEVDGVELKAFGTGVPDRVAEVLRVTETNFQDQHDAAYWLSLSSGEVSRQLNAVVDLGVIDTAFSNIGTKIRSIQQRTALLLERVKKAKEARDRLAWVPEASEAYRAVEAAQEAARASQKRRGRLEAHIRAVRGLLKGMDRKRARYEGLLAVGRAYRAAMDALGKSELLAKKIEAARKARAAARRKVPDTGRLDEAIVKVVQARKRIGALNSLLATAHDRVTKLEERRRSYNEIVKKIEAVGVVVCETCGQPVEGL
jgi:chromosome segregation ATPase